MTDDLYLSPGIYHSQNPGRQRVWGHKVIDDRCFSNKSVLWSGIELGAVLFYGFEQGFDGGNGDVGTVGGAEHIAGGLQVAGFNVVGGFEGSSGQDAVALQGFASHGELLAVTG